MANSKAVMALDDIPMWKSMERQCLELQHCDVCSTFRYPPAPVCPSCLSEKSTWRPVSGKGTILAWVIFHKKYFDDYPPPYNSITVELDEGPYLVTQLKGPEPAGNWIGARIRLAYAEHAGRMQHHALLVTDDA